MGLFTKGVDFASASANLRATGAGTSGKSIMGDLDESLKSMTEGVDYVQSALAKTNQDLIDRANKLENVMEKNAKKLESFKSDYNDLDKEIAEYEKIIKNNNKAKKYKKVMHNQIKLKKSIEARIGDMSEQLKMQKEMEKIDKEAAKKSKSKSDIKAFEDTAKKTRQMEKDLATYKSALNSTISEMDKYKRKYAELGDSTIKYEDLIHKQLKAQEKVENALGAEIEKLKQLKREREKIKKENPYSMQVDLIDNKEAIKEQEQNVKKYRQELRKTNDELANYQKRYEKLQDAPNMAKDAKEEQEELKKAFRETSKEYEVAAGVYKRNNEKIKKSNGEMRTSFQKLQDKLAGVGYKFALISAAMEPFRQVKQIIDGLQKIEDAAFSLGIVGQMSSFEIKKMRNEMLLTATDGIFAATELAAAQEAVVRTGRSLAEAQEIVSSTATLATAAYEDLSFATTSVNKVMTAFKMESNQAEETMSALYNVINSTPLSLKSLDESMRQAAPAFGTLISFTNRSGEALRDYKQQVLETEAALTGAMALMGKTGAQSGTSLKMFMTKILALTPQASKMFDTELQGKGTDYSADQLSKDVVENIDEAMNKLSKLFIAGETSFDTIQKMFGARHAPQIAQVLVEIGGDMEEYKRLVGQGRDLSADASKAMGSWSSQVKRLDRNLDALNGVLLTQMDGIGSALTGLVNKILEGVNSLANSGLGGIMTGSAITAASSFIAIDALLYGTELFFLKMSDKLQDAASRANSGILIKGVTNLFLKVRGWLDKAVLTLSKATGTNLDHTNNVKFSFGQISAGLAVAFGIYKIVSSAYENWKQQVYEFNQSRKRKYNELERLDKTNANFIEASKSALSELAEESSLVDTTVTGAAQSISDFESAAKGLSDSLNYESKRMFINSKIKEIENDPDASKDDLKAVKMAKKMQKYSDKENEVWEKYIHYMNLDQAKKREEMPKIWGEETLTEARMFAGEEYGQGSDRYVNYILEKKYGYDNSELRPSSTKVEDELVNLGFTTKWHSGLNKGLLMLTQTLRNEWDMEYAKKSKQNNVDNWENIEKKTQVVSGRGRGYEDYLSTDFSSRADEQNTSIKSFDYLNSLMGYTSMVGGEFKKINKELTNVDLSKLDDSFIEGLGEFKSLTRFFEELIKSGIEIEEFQETNAKLLKDAEKWEEVKVTGGNKGSIRAKEIIDDFILGGKDREALISEGISKELIDLLNDDSVENKAKLSKISSFIENRISEDKLIDDAENFVEKSRRLSKRGVEFGKNERAKTGRGIDLNRIPTQFGGFQKISKDFEFGIADIMDEYENFLLKNTEDSIDDIKDRSGESRKDITNKIKNMMDEGKSGSEIFKELSTDSEIPDHLRDKIQEFIELFFNKQREMTDALYNAAISKLDVNQREETYQRNKSSIGSKFSSVNDLAGLTESKRQTSERGFIEGRKLVKGSMQGIDISDSSSLESLLEKVKEQKGKKGIETDEYRELIELEKKLVDLKLNEKEAELEILRFKQEQTNEMKEQMNEYRSDLYDIKPGSKNNFASFDIRKENAKISSGVRFRGDAEGNLRKNIDEYENLSNKSPNSLTPQQIKRKKILEEEIELYQQLLEIEEEKVDFQKQLNILEEDGKNILRSESSIMNRRQVQLEEEIRLEKEKDEDKRNLIALSEKENELMEIKLSKMEQVVSAFENAKSGGGPSYNQTNFAKSLTSMKGGTSFGDLDSANKASVINFGVTQANDMMQGYYSRKDKALDMEIDLLERRKELTEDEEMKAKFDKQIKNKRLQQIDTQEDAAQANSVMGGVSAGVAIGTMVGGPVGAVVGAGIGLLSAGVGIGNASAEAEAQKINLKNEEALIKLAETRNKLLEQTNAKQDLIEYSGKGGINYAVDRTTKERLEDDIVGSGASNYKTTTGMWWWKKTHDNVVEDDVNIDDEIGGMSSISDIEKGIAHSKQRQKEIRERIDNDPDMTKNQKASLEATINAYANAERQLTKLHSDLVEEKTNLAKQYYGADVFENDDGEWESTWTQRFDLLDEMVNNAKNGIDELGRGWVYEAAISPLIKENPKIQAGLDNIEDLMVSEEIIETGATKGVQTQSLAVLTGEERLFGKDGELTIDAKNTFATIGIEMDKLDNKQKEANESVRAMVGYFIEAGEKITNLLPLMGELGKGLYSSMTESFQASSFAEGFNAIGSFAGEQFSKSFIDNAMNDEFEENFLGLYDLIDSTMEEGFSFSGASKVRSEIAKTMGQTAARRNELRAMNDMLQMDESIEYDNSNQVEYSGGSTKAVTYNISVNNNFNTGNFLGDQTALEDFAEVIGPKVKKWVEDSI